MEHIFILSFLVFAIHYTMQEGEIFEGLGKLFSRLPSYVHDPLYDCPVCMVPWYGSIIFLIFWQGDVTEWIMTIFPAMGLNAIILKLAPDKDTPGLHHELGEITERLTDIGQCLKPDIICVQEKEDVKINLDDAISS